MRPRAARRPSGRLAPAPRPDNTTPTPREGKGKASGYAALALPGADVVGSRGAVPPRGPRRRPSSPGGGA